MEKMWMVTFLVIWYCAMTLAQVVIRETGFSDQYKSQNTLGEYTFGYNEDHTTGGSFRRETSDRLGNKIGSYGLRIGDGRVRIVNYVADRNGFRANVFSNEPGLESQGTSHFSKITKGRIFGVLVPGFRYSSIAPHVTFESSALQINKFLDEVPREDGSNLPKSVQPHGYEDKGVVNRHAGKSNSDVFANESFHDDDAHSKPQGFGGEGRANGYAYNGDTDVFPNEAFSEGDVYSKPHSFDGEDMTNKYHGEGNVGDFPNEGFRGGDAYSKTLSFDGEDMTNKYHGKANVGDFPNEGFRGGDAYSKSRSFDGEDMTNKYHGEGNVGNFPNEGFNIGDAYPENQPDSSNLYKKVEGKVLADPSSNGENSYKSPESFAPTGTSGLQLEQKASGTSSRVQKEHRHSASISTSEEVNGAARGYEKKDRNGSEISTTFGDLNSFPSTIVLSKQAAEKNATFHEVVGNNDKNATVDIAADA